MLESGRFTRLGGRSRGASTRACSPRRSRVSSSRAGTRTDFRRDLLAHLNTLIVRVPPLRDYAEDVPELLRHYVDRAVDDGRPAVPALQRRGAEPPAQLPLARQRARAEESRAAAADPGRTGGDPARGDRARARGADPPGEPLVKQDLLALPLREAREQFERAYLQQQLLLCNGKVGQLAKRVGMERTHLYRKLRSLGVDFRNVSED